MPNLAEGLLWAINATLTKMAVAILCPHHSVSQGGAAFFLLQTRVITPSLLAFLYCPFFHGINHQCLSLLRTSHHKKSFYSLAMD